MCGAFHGRVMTLRRRTFMTISALVALAVGTFALALPRALLQSKGVALPNEAAVVWVREVGVTIFAVGVTLLLSRSCEDLRALRAIFAGNAVVHLGLLPIELDAYQSGAITRLSGVAPNSALHIVLGSAFLLLALRTRG